MPRIGGRDAVVKPALTTPRQHDYQDPTVERSERRLRRWLEELPLMSPLQALPPLNEALEALNAQPMEAPERLRLLDHYRPAAGKLFMALQHTPVSRLYTDAADRERAVGELGVCVQALAGGYKLAVRALLDARPRLRRRLLPLALLRAMEHLAQLLLHAYRYYLPAPPFVMLELHQLFRQAHAEGCLDMTPPHVPADRQPVTLEVLYRQTLLATLMDPYHLPEGELARLFPALAGYAGSCELSAGQDWEGDGEGFYLVDLCSDSPPRPCVTLTARPDAEEPWVLDGRPALQAMHRQLARAEPAQRRHRPEVRMLRALLPRTEAGERRRAVREPRERDVLVIAGVSGVHRYLAGRPVRDEADPADAAIPEPALWRVLDESDAGLQLARTEGGESGLSVGELVLVVSGAGDGAPRSPGDDAPEAPPPVTTVVRWLRRGNDGRTAVGLECLPGAPAPVRCRSEELDGPAVECLFLPGVAGRSNHATLLVPAESFQEGQALEVLAGRRTVAVRPGAAQMATACFERLPFTSDSDS